MKSSALVEHDKVRERRWASARAAMVAKSPRVRRDAVITVSALAGPDAYEPLIAALGDPDRKVRFNALLGLSARDRPEAYADAIVGVLATHGSGPRDAVAAREVVDLRVGPGVLIRLGIASRLLPAIEELSREGDGRRRRRHAALLSRALRAQLELRD